jgi:SAM-dependent MidA family methyltransferase
MLPPKICRIINNFLQDHLLLRSCKAVYFLVIFLWRLPAQIKMRELTDIIVRSIHDKGSISFKNFMEMALYYPRLGYYVSSGKKIGTDGDYFTSPALSSVFGNILSKQIMEMWQLMGKKKFTIIEYGAGNGDLCCDILETIRHCYELYDRLDYFIIEKNGLSAEKQRSFFHPKVKWIDSIEDLSNISGCIISNELIDNFAVHAVVMQEELMEVFIGHDGNSFYELYKPASDELKNYFFRLGVTLPKGFRTEVNLQTVQWLKEIAGILKEGFVMTIDYGSISDELYATEKRCGSILCYHKHQINNEPLLRIGEQDITAHVNFSALKLWGIENDLEFCGYTNQSQFLRSCGLM